MTGYEMVNMLSIAIVLIGALKYYRERSHLWADPLLRGGERTLLVAFMLFVSLRLVTVIVDGAPFPGLILAPVILSGKIVVGIFIWACVAQAERHKEANRQQAVQGKAELARRGVPLEEFDE